MKNLKCLLLFFAALMTLAGCQKEKTASGILKQTNVSKLVIQKYTNTSSLTTQNPFSINYAGIFQEFLYMSLSYTGGEKIHEFVVNWDGTIKDEGDKKVIELTVTHSTANDNGIRTVCDDSIRANILDLGITKEELNNPDLWLRVTNSTNSNNVFFFKAASYAIIDPVIVDPFSRDVKVVKEGCSDYGLWGDLWLISNDANPVTHYFVTEIDKTISYTPVANDLLKIEFTYSNADSSTFVCSQYKQLKPLPIKITKLVK